MNKLTSRDKVLLGILALVAVVFGFYRFVYTPLTVEVEENTVLLEEYNEQRVEMMNIISRYGSQDETISALKDNIDTKLGMVSEYRSNDELEDYVIALTDGFDLDVTSVAIAEYEIVQMDPIIDEESLEPMMSAETEDGETVTTYVMKDYVCEIFDCSEGVYVDSAIPSVMMERNTLQIELEGNKDDFKDLLDIIENDNKSMILVLSSEVYESGKENLFVLTLDIYSIRGW